MHTCKTHTQHVAWILQRATGTTVKIQAPLAPVFNNLLSAHTYRSVDNTRLESEDSSFPHTQMPCSGQPSLVSLLPHQVKTAENSAQPTTVSHWYQDDLFHCQLSAEKSSRRAGEGASSLLSPSWHTASGFQTRQRQLDSSDELSPG